MHDYLQTQTAIVLLMDLIDRGKKSRLDRIPPANSSKRNKLMADYARDSRAGFRLDR